MIGKPKDGGPAFPREDYQANAASSANGHFLGQEGMSLRDYFAAKAMHAELNTAGMNDEAATCLAEAAHDAKQTIEERIAFNAYKVADAMLAERIK